jgi:hypothetical protein
MTTSTTSRTRLFITAAIMVLASIACSYRATAQPCRCENITVSVDPDVLCTVTLHPAAPLCRFAPVPVAPGSITQIPCCDDMSISIATCDGSDATFIQGGPNCFYRVPIAPGCCVDACVSVDDRGCIHIRIRRSFAKCVVC